jgi:hypothetical protein
MRSSEIFSWFSALNIDFSKSNCLFHFFCSNWMFSRNSLRALVFKTLFTCLISINSIKINRLFIFVYDITRQSAMLEDSQYPRKKHIVIHVIFSTFSDRFDRCRGLLLCSLNLFNFRFLKEIALYFFV